MNTQSLIRMIVRMFARKIIGKGIDTAIGAGGRKIRRPPANGRDPPRR